MTTEILLKSFQSLNGFLVDTRFMDMALLAYAGFLRLDKLSNLRLKENDVVDFSANSWEVYSTSLYEWKILDLIVSLFGQLNSLVIRIDTNNFSFGFYLLSKVCRQFSCTAA